MLFVVGIFDVYVAGTAVEEMFDVLVLAFTFDIFVAVDRLFIMLHAPTVSHDVVDVDFF